MNFTSKLLASGHYMPLLGLGTWQAAPGDAEAAVLAALQAEYRHLGVTPYTSVVLQAAPGDAEAAVLAALQAGYRHIDTAAAYKNEREVGNAIQSWLKTGGRRDELFVTTKLPHIGNRASDVKTYFMNSLQNLQLEYLDLYLMHMPFTLTPDETGAAPAKHPDGTVVWEETDHSAVWKEMENLVKSGLVRSIGVSNFNGKQLERLMNSVQIPPANLQVEMHVALQQPELQMLCRERGVALTAYSPLGSPGSKDHFKNKYGRSDFDFPDILSDPAVNDIANRLNRTPAQILLRFLVQQEIAVIPKSINQQRIIENFQIFDFTLPQEEIGILKGLDRGPKGRIVNFLFFTGVEKHPEYPFRSELQ